MNKSPKDIFIQKKEIKLLFRNATGFCAWGEYERGYKLRDISARAGIDYYLSEFKNNHKSIDKKILLKIKYNHLFKVIREIIDKSYYLYYEVNGTFREDKFKASERNEIADKYFKEFIDFYSKKNPSA